MKTTLFLLLCSVTVKAASIAECKIAIVDFNHSHKQVHIAVQKYVNGDEMGFVVQIQKHENSTREQAEFNKAVRVCLESGFGTSVVFADWGSTKMTKSCSIFPRTMGITGCANVETPVEIPNFAEVKL